MHHANMYGCARICILLLLCVVCAVWCVFVVPQYQRTTRLANNPSPVPFAVLDAVPVDASLVHVHVPEPSPEPSPRNSPPRDGTHTPRRSARVEKKNSNSNAAVQEVSTSHRERGRGGERRYTRG